MPAKSATQIATVPDKVRQRVRKPYPNFKVIVLDDDFNTIDHVQNCIQRYIPQMTAARAYELTMQVHLQGQAIVWVGPQETS